MSEIKLADNFEQTQDYDDDFTVSCYVCKHSAVRFDEHPCKNCCRNPVAYSMSEIKLADNFEQTQGYDEELEENNASY